ncbi:MAG: hypothetical protein IKL97_06480 [Eggerthellaceae bacterium]|nr:hypothetical protein [Eggerthellaceae bacterium]
MFEKMHKISRKEEAQLPEFSSHAEARKHFVGKYGDNFVAVDSFIVSDDRICYEYHLVLDRDAYTKGMRALYESTRGTTGSSSSSEVTSVDQFLHSYQKIEIMDEGSVHILH